MGARADDFRAHYPPGTPRFSERDFIGASHSALVDHMKAEYVDPAAFHRALIETIEAYGASFNQRALIDAALDRLREARSDGP